MNYTVSRVHIKQLFLLAVILLLAGCMGTAVRKDTVTAFSKGLGQVFTEIGKEGHTLRFLVSWYYRAENQWPKNRQSLEKFIKKHNAPVTLEHYEQIVLKSDSEESLCCYIFTAPQPSSAVTNGTVTLSKVSGSFRISKEEALAEEYDCVNSDSFLLQLLDLQKSRSGENKTLPAQKPN